jgi:hypothetical protein
VVGVLEAEDPTRLIRFFDSLSHQQSVEVAGIVMPKRF